MRKYVILMMKDGVSNLDEKVINGLNLYAYCGNNPVMNTDSTGCFWSAVSGWFSRVGESVERFFDKLKNLFDNIFESFYFDAGAGWGFGVGFELSPVGSFELMAVQGGGLEALPVLAIGMFEKIVVSLILFNYLIFLME